MTRKCEICNNNIPATNHYCNICKGIVKRFSTDSKIFREYAIKALKAGVSGSPPVFKCYYTNILLNITDSSSPWYLSFDHQIPGDVTTLVITSQYINDMKTDLDEIEFKNSIKELYNYFNKGIPINFNTFTFKYWKRRRIKKLLKLKRGITTRSS